jgi:endonuclease/exonuclease/phosphatase family metal-dependent hydrolase
MPYYYRLKWDIRPKEKRDRVIDHLIALKRQLDRDIPAKDAEENLLLATWNIRDLGKSGGGRGFGERQPEALYYIAEVLSRFDLVAVQEVNELAVWEKVMDILGPGWDYVATEVTDPKLGGNGERMTFAFDKRKVWFQNIAGEIVLPVDMLISKVEVPGDDKLYAGKQFRRTPFITRFQSGWLRFDICTVHLYYGAESGAKLQERIEEIGRIAGYLSGRADEALIENRGLILLGDFNIVHPEHETMKALLDTGFVVPQALRKPTNISATDYYDQIAFKVKPEVIEYVDNPAPGASPNGGVFESFESVYTEDQFEHFKDDVQKSPNGSGLVGDAALREYYMREWRTYQLSDHKPLWVRLKTNESEAYLKHLKG